MIKMLIDKIKMDEIIKRCLFLKNNELERISIEYNINLAEFNYLMNWFQVENSDAQFNANYSYEKTDNIPVIMFHNGIIDIQNSINELLNGSII